MNRAFIDGENYCRLLEQPVIISGNQQAIPVNRKYYSYLRKQQPNSE